MTAQSRGEVTGRRAPPAGPFALYQRLTGYPPNRDQQERLGRIGRLIEAGPDDVAWGLLVAHEAYLNLVHESTRRTARAVRTWCMGLLAAVILVACLIATTVLRGGSADFGAVVGREVARALDRQPLASDPRPGCEVDASDEYCKATRAAGTSPSKQKVVIAASTLSEDTAIALARFPDLARTFTWMAQLTPTQWQEINAALAPKPARR